MGIGVESQFPVPVSSPIVHTQRRSDGGFMAPTYKRSCSHPKKGANSSAGRGSGTDRLYEVDNAFYSKSYRTLVGCTDSMSLSC